MGLLRRLWPNWPILGTMNWLLWEAMGLLWAQEAVQSLFWSYSAVSSHLGPYTFFGNKNRNKQHSVRVYTHFKNQPTRFPFMYIGMERSAMRNLLGTIIMSAIISLSSAEKQNSYFFFFNFKLFILYWGIANSFRWTVKGLSHTYTRIRSPPNSPPIQAAT